MGALSWNAMFLAALGIIGTFISMRRMRRQRMLSRAQDPSAFKGKVVWITGASSGIGEALALCFFRAGATVILSARREEELERVRAGLLASTRAGAGTPAPTVAPLDLTKSDQFEEVVAKVVAAHGRVDVLVNNGGMSSRSGVLDTSMAVDRRVMEVNFFGTIALTKAVLPHMVARGGGHLVVVSSVQGRLGMPLRSSYGASKHALHGWFEGLRGEVADQGVHVMTVCPGYVRTQLSVNAVTGDGSSHGLMDASTATGLSPQAVALRILAGVLEREGELWICDVKSKVAMLVQIVAPKVVSAVLQKRAKRQALAEHAAQR